MTIQSPGKASIEGPHLVLPRHSLRRPDGPYADEWQLYLKEVLDCQWVDDSLPFLAVQICEAIEAARPGPGEDCT